MPIFRSTWSRIGVLLSALLLLPLLWLLQPKTPAEYRLTLLHFNDFHGQLASFEEGPDKRSVGGLARLAGTVDAIRKASPDRPVLLLFAGDLLQGSMLSSLYHGRPDIDLFNAMGMDAAVLGNHELDYGQENLIERVKQARFPILSANAQIPGTGDSLRSHTVIKTTEGLRVGILGLTTPELLTTTHPRNTKGVTVADTQTVASRLMDELSAQSDIQILLSHLGFSDDQRMARELKGIDLIVGGHNHFTFDQPRREGEVLILQAGERGHWLGRMDLRVKEGKVTVEDYRLIPIDASSPVDTAMAQRVDALSREVSKEMDRVVGHAAIRLDGSRETARRVESNLGDFIADQARRLSQVDVVLLNGGTFRDSIDAGPVTLGKIHRVFPFGNEVVTGRILGSELQRALDQSASLNPDDNPGGFLQVSGLRYTIANGRAVDVQVAGQPLRPDAEYSIATSDFLAEGGDGYAFLIQAIKQKRNTGNLLLDMVVTAFQEHREIRVETDGRIQRR